MNKRSQRRLYMCEFRKKHPIIARRRVKDSFDKHPTRYAAGRSVSEIRLVIRSLTKKTLPERIPTDVLYEMMVTVILKDKGKAFKKYPFGIPDASEEGVELKIGFDRLHGSQLVRNVLSGQTFKVRWFESYDDLERTLRDGQDRSKLFQSYKDFILWRYEKCQS
jgi:hypothetical protein